MRSSYRSWVLVLMCGVGLGSACSANLDGEADEGEAFGPDAYRIIARGTVPGVRSELSGLTRGDGFFFTVHRDSGQLVITQIVVDDWARGQLRNLAQGRVAFGDPEGLSYIDKQGGAWRFVAAAEGGRLRIVEMNGNALSLQAEKRVGDYGNDGIEGVCYYDGYIYYGLQGNGKLYRVRFDSQAGTFGDRIENIDSASASVRDLTVIGDGLYALSGSKLTRVAGKGDAEIRIPFRLRQPEGVAYSATKGVIMVVGEPNEYGMFDYRGGADPNPQSSCAFSAAPTYFAGKRVNNDDGSCNQDGLAAYLKVMKDGNEFDKDKDRPACWITTMDWAIVKDSPRDYQQEVRDFQTSATHVANQASFAALDMQPALSPFLDPALRTSCLPLKQGRCADGWVECRGMCYSTITRNSSGLHRHDNENDFLEARCATCQGGRVALVHPQDQQLMDFASAILLNQRTQNKKITSSDDQQKTRERGLWVRRRLFNTIAGKPAHGQGWAVYANENPDNDSSRMSESQLASYDLTYARVVPDQGWRLGKYEADILCMQNIDKAKSKDNDGGACPVKDQAHKWSCALKYPCPGC